MDSIFFQIGLVIIVAAGLGIVAKLFKQPLLLAYIAAGIVLGSGGLQVITDVHVSQEMATIGIVFLLFLVGLELDIDKVKELGRVILVTGLVQMGLIAAGGYAVARLLGYPEALSWYLGLAAAFSSTAVVLKRLADRRELSSLQGRLSVGILILQDIVAIIALMVISGLSHGNGGSDMLYGFLLKGALLLGGTWLISRYVLNRVFYHIAKSTELLFLTSIAWAFLYAFIAESLGFTAEIGAFMAGLSLASLPYALEIIGRVKPLKDFFLVIFFVVLGLEVSLPVIGTNLMLIAALTVLVLLVKSFITAVFITRCGYPKRPAYLVGAGLGQMSEFSLLLALLGLSYGHINGEGVAIIASVMVISIILNTYWNGLNRFIYPLLSRPLVWLGGRTHRELSYRPQGLSDHILLFGANRVGLELLKTVEKMKREVTVIDHNPDIIRRLLRRGVKSVYGDIDDYELLEDMGLDKAGMILSTVPVVSSNLYLIQQVRNRNEHALVIVTAEQVGEALSLYAAGADYVILPRIVGGEAAARLLAELDEAAPTGPTLAKERRAHIEHLKLHQHELLA